MIGSPRTQDDQLMKKQAGEQSCVKTLREEYAEETWRGSKTMAMRHDYRSSIARQMQNTKEQS